MVTFDVEVRTIYTVEGSDNLPLLYEDIAAEEPGGGTDMYAAALKGIDHAVTAYDLNNYCPAVIIMSDGASKTDSREEFIGGYKACGYDIPVFSIMFGDADDSQLNELAELTNARVFDGRNDLVGAFRSVKGYN